MIRVSVFSNDLCSICLRGVAGLVYIGRSVQREPFDATKEAVENRHYNVEADRWA